MQISVSKGTGRIIGFFGNDYSVFYVVLLDPNHNIQPAAKNNYQIQPTTQGLSQYDDLLGKMETIRKTISDCDHNCQLHNQIKSIEALHENIIYMGLDRDLYTKYVELSQEYTLNDILEVGIFSLQSLRKSGSK